MDPIELYTKRLKIRNMVVEDWKNFQSIQLDHRVNRHIRQCSLQVDIARKFQDELQPWELQSGRWLSLAIETIEGEFIGFMGFYCEEMFCKRVELGYLLSPRQHYKGYATEAVRALIDWICLTFDINKIVANVTTDNKKSVNVLKKNGFVIEGILRKHQRIKNEWVDMYVLGLLTEYRNKK